MRKNGYEEFVKHTFSKHKKYYLVEEQMDVYKYDPKKGKRVLSRLSALNMLDKILIAPLSTAEKIEAGQMQAELCAFEKKGLFSAKEVSAINDKFSRLLKLSAKYGV